MKFNELSHMMQKPEPKPDTYEAGMALNQLLKIGTHAIKIHNMIDDDAEMEAWVAKKIDLASNYVKSVHGYTAGSKAGTYDDDGMSEDASGWKLVSKAKDIAKKMAGNLTGAVRQIEKLQKDLSKNSSVKQALAQFNEDAGEGHMSKSTLYHTAKYAIELMDMINQGEGVLQKRVFDLPIGPGSPISGREKGVSKPNRFAQRIMGIKPRRAYNLTQGPVTKGEAAQIIVQSCLKKR